MPTTQASTTNFSDHRIFGFDLRGHIRVSLFNGPGCHAPGARYSWVISTTPRQLAEKLARQWEQPVSNDEWDAIEQLTDSMNNVEVPCDDCGGTGVDAGGLDPLQAEQCRTCHGAQHVTLASLYQLNEEKPAAKRIPAVAALARKDHAA